MIHMTERVVCSASAISRRRGRAVDFGFSEEQDMLREASRRFLDQEMPVAAVRSYLETDGPGYDVDVWRKAATLGWFGLLVPETFGGTAQSIVDAVVVAEELGRAVQPGP